VSKLPDTFECHRLRAKITERQCKLNREGYRSRGINFPSITSCQGCTGLGESAHVPAPVRKETTKMTKHRCNKKNCTRAVKNAGDFCWQHKDLADQIEAGTVKTVISDNKLSEVTAPVRRLTDAAQDDRDDFEAKFDGGNCSCHINPPCSSCLHPGNPANQEEDETAWTTELEAEQPANPVKAFSENSDTQGALAEQSTTVRENRTFEPMHFTPPFGHGHYACGVPDIMGTLGVGVWVGVTCENCLIWKQLNESPAAELDQVSADSFEADCSSLMGDDTENLAQASTFKGLAHFMTGGLLPDSGIIRTDLASFRYTPKTELPDVQFSPVASTPPQEQPQVTAGERTPLGRLLRFAVPPPLCGSIVLDFDIYQLTAIQESELTKEDLKEVILMLIAGELGKVVQFEDPLAKSRVHAAD
jgi:hypothetical protein